MPVDFAALRAGGHVADAEHVRRDALHFLTLLYTPEPAGLILINTPHGRSWPTHACKTPEGAVPWVIGIADVYHRVTLVEHKPRNGRGSEADSVALPGLYLDVDVDRSPDGRGGLITGAAPDAETAVAFLRCVTPPTVLVMSGYGIHAYWLFGLDVWKLTDDHERQHAKDLLRGFHKLMKAQARRFDIAKLDTVSDLARVLRPVGSLNGKGSPPPPVRLLVDDGPYYGVADLQGLVKAASYAAVQAPAGPSAAIPAGAPAGGHERAAGELVEAYAALARIVNRTATTPGKGSDSEWDHYLTCTAVEPPCNCTDDELAALIRHNRATHPDPNRKADRADYVQRTIDSARAHTGIGTPGDTTAWTRNAPEPLELINRLWNCAERPIIGMEAIGRGLDATVVCARADGTSFEIEKLRYLFDRAAHNREVSAAAYTKFPPLSQAQCQEIAQAVIEICRPAPDDTRREETTDLLTTFAADVGEIIDGVMHGSVGQRYAALLAVVAAEHKLPSHPEPARRACAIRDELGRLWLPAAAVRAAARHPSWGEMHTRVALVGWERCKVEPRAPRNPKDRPTRVFYVQPAENDDGPSSRA